MHVIGLDLGGTKLMAARFNQNGQVVAGPVIKKVRGLEEPQLIGAITDTLQGLMSPQTIAIGCGIPATIDQEQGMAVFSANLPLRNYPIRDLVEQATGIKTYIDNDATLAGLAEYHQGALIGIDQAILLTLGTGIGGSVLINGQTYSGPVGGGGEIGHMSINFEGPICSALNCNRRGCLESYCSGRALENLGIDPAKAMGATNIEGIFQDQGRALGIGIGNLSNILGIETFVIGGGYGIAFYDQLIPHALTTAKEAAISPMKEHLQIMQAELGPKAGMIGGAIMALTKEGVLQG